MDNTSYKALSLTVSVLVIVIAAAGFFGWRYWNEFRMERMERERAETPMNVETTVTPFEDGVLSAPEGFPEEIPVEDENIVQSETSTFADWSAVKRSVMYHSEESIESKHGEYRSFMESSGYSVTETKGENGLVTLTGDKDGENLSVTITLWEEFTRVFITHLDLSVN